MRVVADTNTILSGLLWQGAPRRLLELARQRKITLCTSLTLLAELAEVIARDKFLERLRAAKLSAAELIREYERLADTVTTEPLAAPVVIRDPDDDHVLACALAAQARLIVSGDAHLLDLGGSYRGIPIRGVSAALDELSVPAPQRRP